MILIFKGATFYKSVFSENNYSPKDGKLGDIAPTVLKIMGIDIPNEMSGNILI